MRLTLLAAALLIAAAPAAAHEPQLESRFSAGYGTCMDNANGTYEMLECANDEYAIQDQALNDAYRKAMEGLNARQQGRLRAAQRAWIAFRDAKCESLQDQDWGTLSTVTARMCRVDETVRRLIELEEYPPV